MKTDGVAIEIGLPSAVGFVVGVLTAVAVYGLYPPVKDHTWPMWTLTLGSIALLLVVYVTAQRIGAVRAGESLVVGYGIALVLAASLVVTNEIFHVIRDHVPDTLGVKRVGLSRVEVIG